MKTIPNESDMNITSIQKVIKVGSSLAVTIPAKDAKYYAISPGENLQVSLNRPAQPMVNDRAVELVDLTQKLIARHQKALKNLSQR